MPECIQCGSFTKYANGKCYSCYSGTNDTHTDDEILDIEISERMTDKERSYRYNMIKGRIAETLVQELFLSLGYNVFSYGMENTVPGIMKLLKGVKSDVALQIRRMPDFVIQSPTSNEVYFIEVKFRANGTYKEKDLPKSYPYDNAYIILVSKRHIKCITVEELRKGKEITPECRNYLGSRKEFELNKEVIKEFCEFAVQFFEKV